LNDGRSLEYFSDQKQTLRPQLPENACPFQVSQDPERPWPIKVAPAAQGQPPKHVYSAGRGMPAVRVFFMVLSDPAGECGPAVVSQPPQCGACTACMGAGRPGSILPGAAVGERHDHAQGGR